MRLTTRKLFFLLIVLLQLLLPAASPLSADSTEYFDQNRSWTENGLLKESAYELLTAIRSDSTILCGKKRYRLERIDELLQKSFLSEDFRSRLNSTLNHTFSLYESDRKNGCLDPFDIYGEQIYIERSAEYNATKREENTLLERLESALERYENLRSAGGWKRVPETAALLKKGDFSEDVKLIKERLLISGDLNETDVSNPLFDESLESAVKIFQTRHNLKSDGIVGPVTRSAMNIPIESKISLIKMNIERLRWLTSGAKDFIVANIPEYSLTLYRDNSVKLTMKTVVGRKTRPTPMISDMMSYAILNPYWRAPKTIVKEDILPKLKAGMFDYLRKIGIVVSRSMDGNESVDMESVDWRRYNGGDLPFIFMQKPGPLNYLGFVKFMFPNGLDIYIHDTPHGGLFEYKDRTLSSGCVRVQKPVELFHALFSDDERDEWSYKQIIRQIIKREEKPVGLRKPVPVYILYMTAYADEHNRVHFLPDIYGYDKKMERYLDESAGQSEHKSGSSYAGGF